MDDQGKRDEKPDGQKRPGLKAVARDRANLHDSPLAEFARMLRRVREDVQRRKE